MPNEHMKERFHRECVRIQAEMNYAVRQKPSMEVIARAVYASCDRRSTRADEVLPLVAALAGVKVETVTGGGRSTRASEVRWLCAAVLRDVLKLSYSEISARLGSANHSTAMSAYKAWKRRAA